MNEVLRRIEELRVYAGQCLAQSFEIARRENLSEKALTDLSLAYLRRNKDLFEDGWYAPPPHGIITVFGKKDDNFKKVSQPSFRPESEWPQDSRYYDDEDIVLFYASPIDRITGLIGDFGLNLYSGSNKEIREHFENVLRATLHIASQAKIGMSFSELYQLAIEYGKTCGFYNNIESSADITGTNIGHTIPLSFPDDQTHAAIAQAKDYEEIKEAIRSYRVFVNAACDQRIQSDMAFTIEPRFSTDTMPNTLFHLTMIFENGEKRICHGFEPIMQQASMDYLLHLLP